MAASKTQPALLGGLTIGVLSALPVINLANCCCAWILFGGALAAYLMQQNQPEPINTGDGAVVGLMAGAIGAVVWLVISIPMAAIMAPFEAAMMSRAMRDASDAAPELRAFFEMFSGSAGRGLNLAIGFFVMLVLSTIFATFGGIFGALLFRKDPPPPVIPPVPPIGSPGSAFTPPTFTPPPPPPPAA